MKQLILVCGAVLCVACGDSSDTERCEAGSCDDGNACTLAQCNVETGMCEIDFVSDGTSCADGAGQCEAGECIAFCGSGQCDDGNECTNDRCDVTSGKCEADPVLQPVPCDFEGATGICDAGECIDAGTCENAVEKCDDGKECTMDRCDPANGECSNSSMGAEGARCDNGAGVCASGSCEIAPQTKRFFTTCTDTLFDNSAEVPVDLMIDPASAYLGGASDTGFSASFRLDQGLGDFLVGIGAGSTEITALEVNVEISGATPTTVDLPSEQAPPFTIDFADADALDTSTVTEQLVPDGLASSVDFLVSDWRIAILIEHMGVPINTSLSPGDDSAIFSCGPLVPADGSIRYPQ